MRTNAESTYYLDNNLDVMAAVKKGEFKNGYEHYTKQP